MIQQKYINALCCFLIVLAVMITGGVMAGAQTGLISQDSSIGYEDRLFDSSKVHTINIIMDDWDTWVETCSDEEYTNCSVIIDNEAYQNVALRAKGNTSLSNVQNYGNNRYSFKIEFDHYDSGKSYHGLDKLSLNNIIQDNTYMKDFLTYQMMGAFGVNAPLCSYVQILVNGEEWGLYLAVEGVEDSFLARNFSGSGELYKPDSTSMGAGRGQGKEFDMTGWKEDHQQADSLEDSDSSADPADSSMGSTESTDPQEAYASQTEAMPESFAPDSVQGQEFPMEAGMEGMDPASGFDPVQGGMPMEGQPSAMMPSQDSEFQAFNPGGATDSGQMPPAQPDADLNAEADVKTDAAADADFESADAAASEKTGANLQETPAVQKPDGMQKTPSNNAMGSSDVSSIYTDDEVSSYSNIFDNAKTEISEADQKRLIEALKKLFLFRGRTTFTYQLKTSHL